MTKKVISIVLSVIMVVTLIPSLAFATTTGQTDSSQNQGEVIQPVDPKPETKPEVAPPVTPPTEATKFEVVLDSVGTARWSKVAADDKIEYYKAEFQVLDDKGSTWTPVKEQTPVEENTAENYYLSWVDTELYTNLQKIRVVVTYTKDSVVKTATSNEITGTSLPPDKVVDEPIVMTEYYSDISKKYINGIKVTITPNTWEYVKPEFYEVNLYVTEADRDVDTTLGVGLTDKDIVKKDRFENTGKPIEIIYDKTIFYNDDEKNVKPYYVEVRAKKTGDYIPGVVYSQMNAYANNPTTSASMKVVQVKDKPNVIQATHEGLIAGSAFRGYVKIYSSYKDANNENFCINTKEVFGTVDSTGKATYNMDLGEYIFCNDSLKVRAILDAHIGEDYIHNYHYSEIAINNFKPTKLPANKAMFDAIMNGYGDIDFNTNFTHPATTFDYEVKYNNRVVKREYGIKCYNKKKLTVSEWARGLSTPDPTIDLDGYELIITGHRFNCADHVVVVRPKVKKTLYGSIKINLPSSKLGGYATVDLSNLYPLEARNSISYVWYLDGRAVSYDSRYYITPSDLGKTLRVAVSGYNNIKGTVSSPSVTIDNGKPVIKTQPTGYKHYIGDYKQALYVYATTTGSPLKYQWYKDGVAITGATSNSYTPTTEYRGKDEYYCKVYNQEGYVFSNIAVVHNLIRVGTPVLKATKNRHSLVLRWSAADNAKKYKVYERKGGKYKCIKTTTKTYLTVKVRPGSKHVYKIKAINGGCYSYSKPKRFTAKR